MPTWLANSTSSTLLFSVLFIQPSHAKGSIFSHIMEAVILQFLEKLKANDQETFLSSLILVIKSDVTILIGDFNVEYNLSPFSQLPHQFFFKYSKIFSRNCWYCNALKSWHHRHMLTANFVLTLIIDLPHRKCLENQLMKEFLIYKVQK